MGRWSITWAKIVLPLFMVHCRGGEAQCCFQCRTGGKKLKSKTRVFRRANSFHRTYSDDEKNSRTLVIRHSRLFGPAYHLVGRDLMCRSLVRFAVNRLA